MGTFTYANFKDYLTLMLGEKDYTSVGGVDFTGRWINTAYIHLTTQNKFWRMKGEFYFPELHVSDTVDTADGDKSVDSADDILYIEEVFDNTNSRWLKWIPWSKYISYTDRADASAEGQPTEWHRRGTAGTDDLWIHPTADDVYELEFYYRKRPPILSGTSTTIIGTEWDEPILYLAAIKAHQWLHMHDKAAKLKEEWLDMVAGLIGIYDKEEQARRENLKVSPMGKGGYG